MNYPLVYLLHAEEKIGNLQNPHGAAQHYMGFSTDVARRVKNHSLGLGAKLPMAFSRKGVRLHLVRTWRGGRDLESTFDSGKT